MTTQRVRPVRALAGLVAGALTLTVSPLLGAGVAGAADPLPPLANPIADGAVCEGAPGTNPFGDLGAESAATREVILCLVAADLTQGTTATTYTPGGSVTRRQMALFIKRLADLFNDLELQELADLPVYDGTPDFPDHGAEEPAFEEAIGQLAQAEIVGGFPDGEFKPNDLVSRRQMAAFVNRLQAYLTGAPYAASGDYFDDDDGDPGEADLNALAAAGIFQGDGQGNVSPGDDITRRQMANILLRDAQVHFASGSIATPFGIPNETISFGPDNSATLTDAEGDNTAAGPETTGTDNRMFTATALSPTTDYRITLVESDHITTTGQGRRTFAEDGTTGLADPGDVGARIVNVNGAGISPAVQSVGGITPVNGAITVTIDAYRFGTATPVIYVDGGSNTRLELDAGGAPTEGFGVAAENTTLPMEAAAASFDVAVIGVLKDSDTFIGEDGDQQFQYAYDSNDTFRDGPLPVIDGISIADFEARLTRGDNVSGSYNPNPGVASTFELDDISPARPSISSVSDVTPTTATVTVDEANLHPDASVQIFLVTPPGPFDPEAAPARSTSVDAEAAAGFQVHLTGLTPGTSYSVYATQTIDGQRSAASAPATLVTPSAPASVTITDAAVNEFNDGTNGPDVQARSEVVTTFSANVDCDATYAPGDATVTLTSPGPTNTGVSCTEGTLPNQVVFEFDTPFNDASPDQTYVLRVAEGAVVTADGDRPVQANEEEFTF